MEQYNSIKNFKQELTTQPVKGKIPCIYECEIIDAPSKKKNRTTRKRLAINKLNTDYERDLNNQDLYYRITAKIDGTCCRIKNGKLQKRRDIKKGRKIPSDWEETSNNMGHQIGFMPIDKNDKWHLDCMTSNGENINVLKKIGRSIAIINTPITELEGKTVELIGPKIQGNPHEVSQHCVYIHGDIQIKNSFIINKLSDTKNMFLNNPIMSYFEGIVVHFSNGNLYKLHRHHLDISIENGYKPILDLKM